MTIDRSKQCAYGLAKCGRPCTIHTVDGNTLSVTAVIQQVWRRLKSKFEPVTTRIGGAYTDYYMYYGPADCDITGLGQDDIFESDGIQYYFVRGERVIVNGIVQYYAGVLKRIYEGDKNVFG